MPANSPEVLSMDKNQAPELNELTAVSAVDGRYGTKTSSLRAIASEYALIKYRVLVECVWLVHLSEESAVTDLPTFSQQSCTQILNIAEEFTLRDAQSVKDIEARTNHDVKAVEYWLKDKLLAIPEVAPHIEFVHFAATSEDINNCSYAMMLRDIQQDVLPAATDAIEARLKTLAISTSKLPMLSRTHGQPASPTTVGKELANVAARLNRQRLQIEQVSIMGKFNGAVGNFNAHQVAYPKADWQGISKRFIERLGLNYQPYTTQIEPHDFVAELFDAITRYNTILLDFDRDIWGYIALDYFTQKKREGETGSSTMPHKVNPIDFENSEGNLGIANALLGHLARKLPVSRWQRDLSDSTVLRSIGTALGHCLIAYAATQRGLDRIAVNEQKLDADLAGNWEILAEPVQMVMRTQGIEEPYEKLKQLTRGERLSEVAYGEMLASLKLPEALHARLKKLTPAQYLGLATELAEGIDKTLEKN